VLEDISVRVKGVSVSSDGKTSSTIDGDVILNSVFESTEEKFCTLLGVVFELIVPVSVKIVIKT